LRKLSKINTPFNNIYHKPKKELKRNGKLRNEKKNAIEINIEISKIWLIKM
jgi:hypothetical protein